MVYRGKPSPGCALCRKRRLKCDQRQPSCSQCSRINQECPGYQDPRALRVYDQTTAVTTKALARAAITRKSPTEESSKTPPLICLSAPIQEQAMSHIFKYYVGTRQNPGVLPYLSDLIHTDPSEALQATIKAIGLACMSRIYHVPELRRSAGEEYRKALRATNANLQDAVSATSDSTLGAVVTLSLYEVIAIDDFYDILITFNDLSMTIKEAYKNDGFRGNITPLIGQALRLDANLVSWASSLGLAWQFTVARNSPSFSSGDIHIRSYDDEYHVYPSINVAVLWNHYRQARIVLHEMIQAMCLNVSEQQAMPESQQIMLKSSTINKQLVKDVCSSVAHFFTSGEAGFGGVARLPWPLFVAADCTDISPHRKNWIAQILDIIATSAGVQQARILSHFIKEGRHGFNLIPGKSKGVS
ncbi:hypothetical protein BDV30DRAFT_245732 [Aspergillus minisclerotigenes]|uniref:Zn(2)-C6 fungal-type domain-containing protein n=1 Tax=Aspergillus minisclerotigenes TaxID=656917 RepID=A0A5N6IQD2_9EURO|nr:hypothetical protein BDV30DRAFT_245732 [Aspergillus minisclerotigenes]